MFLTSMALCHLDIVPLSWLERSMSRAHIEPQHQREAVTERRRARFHAFCESVGTCLYPIEERPTPSCGGLEPGLQVGPAWRREALQACAMLLYGFAMFPKPTVLCLKRRQPLQKSGQR